MKARLWGTALCCASALLLTHQSLALDTHTEVNYYRRTLFTTRNGLPWDIINGLTQADGFLWIATPSDLVRFDGRSFVPIQLVPEPGTILSVAVGPDDNLWLGTKSGTVMVARSLLNQAGPFHTTTFSTPTSVTVFRTTRDGVLWAGASAGLFRFDGHSFSPTIPDVSISRIEEMNDGHLILTTSRGIIEWDGKQAIAHEEIGRRFGGRSNQIYHVFQDHSGTTWYCSPEGLARVSDGKATWFKLRGQDGGLEPAYRIFEETGGNVWVVMSSGVHRVTSKSLEALLPVTGGRAIFEDRDGNLWIGTNGNGLTRLRDQVIRVLGRSEGLPNVLTSAVIATHDGTLWVGNDCGGLSRFDGVRFHTYDERDGLSNSCVTSLTEDVQHDLWVGTDAGVFQLHGNKFSQYSQAQGLATNLVSQVMAGPDGAIWIADGANVSRLRKGAIRNYTEADGLSGSRSRRIYVDRADTVWAGSEHGLDRLEGDRFVNVARADGAKFISVVGEDASGILYVYADRLGMARVVGGRLTAFIPNLSGQVMNPYNEFLWFVGFRGIERVSAHQLSAWDQARGQPLDVVSFGPEDGLPSLPLDSMAITSDQRLWVPTPQGLAGIDLSRLSYLNSEPSIYAREVSVDGHPQALAQELVLPPGKHHVEFRFDAVDLTAPERIRLEFWMDGVDDEWFEADRLRGAVYQNIPVGRHRLRVRVSNRDGVWDSAGISYWVTQQPFYYETKYFRVAIVLTGLLVIAGLYELRVRQAADRLNAQHAARLGERERIARELHDTLLQSVQGLVLLVEAGTKRIPKSEPLRRLFEETLAHATKVISEGRDRVHNLRDSAKEHIDLSSSLAETAAALSRDTNIDVRVLCDGRPRSVQPEIADEAYWIGREALLNAFRHSRAHTIKVEISYDPRELRMSFRDDGCGIDPQILDSGDRNGHFGLVGMRERATKIGGTLEITSRLTTGTEIGLRVPAASAYIDRPRITLRRWFQGNTTRSEI